MHKPCRGEKFLSMFTQRLFRQYFCLEVHFMQHEKKPSKFKQVMKSRGYYIVLFLCLIAVGTSGYLYYRNSETTTETPPAVESKGESTLKENPTKAPADSDTRKPSTQDVISDEAVSAGQEALTVMAPLDGTTLQPYAMDHLAYNATTHDWRVHMGVDIGGELGQTVCAAADGVVYAIYDDDLLGKTVVLNHSGSYTTYYSNLGEEVNVSVGDAVRAGAAIGVIGETAMVELSEEPHLHFAVYCDSNAMDPAEFLAG